MTHAAVAFVGGFATCPKLRSFVRSFGYASLPWYALALDTSRLESVVHVACMHGIVEGHLRRLYSH